MAKTEQPQIVKSLWLPGEEAAIMPPAEIDMWWAVFSDRRPDPQSGFNCLGFFFKGNRYDPAREGLLWVRRLDGEPHSGPE